MSGYFATGGLSALAAFLLIATITSHLFWSCLGMMALWIQESL